MRRTQSLLAKPDGAIMMISVIVLLAVMVLGIGMLTANRLNAQMAQNTKERVKSFYAADGLMTKVAEQVIGGNGDLYATKLRFTGADIGSTAFAGKDTVVSAQDVDTVWGSGNNGIGGTSDDFHFEYVPLTSDVDVSEKVVSLQNAVGTCPNPKAGIMVRADATAGSMFVFWGVATGVPSGAVLSYRSTAGGNAVQQVYPQYGVGTPIRVDRVHSSITVYVDVGLGWKSCATVNLNLPRNVLVGTAVTSGGPSSLCKATVQSTRGVPSLDTTAVGEYKVASAVTKEYDGSYTITTNAYKLGPNGVAAFTTALNQVVAPAIASQYKSMAQDTIYVPVTFYDFHANGTNPEFQVNGGGGWVTKGMVKTRGLDALRKPIPILRNPLADTCYRHCLSTNGDNCWGKRGPNGWQPRNGDWGWFMCCLISRSYVCSNWWWWCSTCDLDFPAGAHTDGCQGQCPAPSQQNWFWSDSVDRWFRPFGEPNSSTEWDTLTGKWTGLAWDTSLQAWKGNKRNDSLALLAAAGQTLSFDNCVIYDTLPFARRTTWNPHDSNTFVYGDSCDPTRFTFCSGDITIPTAETEHWSQFFHPLMGRGFKYDGPFDSVDGTGMGWRCRDTGSAPVHLRWKFSDWASYGGANFQKQNYSFAMEMHRKFVADTGEIFVFKGNDDLWVFMNDSLVMDEGGVHGAFYDTVKVKNLINGGFMQRQQEYWIDLFYCERNGWGSEILMGTNIMWYDPGRQIQRRWKRDYGSLD